MPAANQKLYFSFFYPLTARRLRPLRWEMNCVCYLLDFAREYYTMIRELPTGKGFADICLIPRKIHMDKPAVIIELKWDKSVSGAIAQIKEKKYIDALSEYQGNLILAGINYDKKIKKHSCLVEKVDYNKNSLNIQDEFLR